MQLPVQNLQHKKFECYAQYTQNFVSSVFFLFPPPSFLDHLWLNEVFRKYQKGTFGKKWIKDITQKLTFTSVTVDLFTGSA